MQLRMIFMNRRQFLTTLAGSIAYASLPASAKDDKYVLTAYTLHESGKSPGHPTYGLTKSGQHVSLGKTIAVDKKYIPLGTDVYIPLLDPKSEEFMTLEPSLQKFLISNSFDGHFTAEDTGKKIRGRRVDVYMGENQGHYKMAVQFGKRKSDVIQV